MIQAFPNFSIKLKLRKNCVLKKCIYFVNFNKSFFSVSQPSIMFSYKPQVDDQVEDDNVSLPHQLSCSSLKTDSDYIYQVSTFYMFIM